MKRFLLYLVIAIAVVSLGLTIYYFSTDNEAIYIKSSYITINKGETISTSNTNNQLLSFKNRDETTKISYTSANVALSDGTMPEEEVLSYNENEYLFVANIGGKSKITVSTTNNRYSKFIIDVLVCDGSEEYPYIIRTEEELNSIKNDSKSLNQCYKLGNDIELTQPWTPISSYGKVFDGNYFTIKNMTITNDSLEGESNSNNVNTALKGGAITNAGFISILEKTGVVKNLFLQNLSINCSIEFVGSFVGTNRGLIQTSEATGTIVNNITSGTIYTGGIAGRVLNDENVKAKIDRCGFEGTIETYGSTQFVGGIAGQNNGGTISETYSRTFVKNGNNKFGGIVGLNQGASEFSSDIYDSYFYLTDKDSTTAFSNMRGVVYNNIDYSSSKTNFVTGCYYGGKMNDSDVSVSPVGDDFSTISSANGYLTSTFNSEETIEFENKTNFVTAEYDSDKETRYWNFDSVWEIPSNVHYPILNVYSSVGSTYLIEVTDITNATSITNAQQLYNALKNTDPNASYKIVNDISCDPTNTFIWGDSSSNHSLPTVFKGTLVNGKVMDGGEERPCVISGLTIKNETLGGEVGLVQQLASSAKIIGVVIDDVTITGVDGKYVGVLAGTSFGAHVYDVKVSNISVEISGKSLNLSAFGGIFGYAYDYEGHGIQNVSIYKIEEENSYFTYAGGIAGVNLGTIATETSNYNQVNIARLSGNYVGGIAGANGGKIYDSNTNNVRFEFLQTTDTITNVYSGKFGVFVGGIAGINEITTGLGTYKGVISNVYANLTCQAETGNNYKVYVGGITGCNTNYITRAYVSSLDVNVMGDKSCFVGGIVGYNMGRIANSVVDNQSKIITSIVSSVGATENYVLRTNDCSIVGGIVGYDAQTSNSTYSIYQCATLANKIQGYYAGGISGISFGKVEYSYCGDSTVENGGVTISGHMIGGISSVIAGGFVYNCYSFCTLNSGTYSGSYKDITSALNMDVRCMGGIAVFVFNSSTKVSKCYAVVKFTGNGVSYGSCADGYNGGLVTNCVYTTSGSINTSIGQKISKANLTGADGYRAFKKAMGTTTVWHLSGYPTLEGVNVRLPNKLMPTA